MARIGLNWLSMVALLLGGSALGGAFAAEVNVVLVDAKGGKVSLQGGGAYLLPANVPSSTVSATAEISQRQAAFRPGTLLIQAGTEVVFSNEDDFNHHVYSFSEVKSFDLELFEKGAAPKIVFDKAGEVAIGCNIHDWMAGFIKVVDTPYIAQSDDGDWRFSNIPPGEYQVYLWHPRLSKKDRQPQALVVKDTPVELHFRLSKKLLPKIEQKAPSVDWFEEDY